MIKKEIENLVSWSRYLYWSDILRKRFDEFMEKPHDIEGHGKWYFYAIMSQWYASVWVVIEGWKKLKLKDAIIDNILEEYSDYCTLLRQYRNCIFHYQENITDKRFIALFEKGEEQAFWIEVLCQEFQRFLWEYPEHLMVTQDQVKEFRESIRECIGWMPTDIISVRKYNLKQLLSEAEDMLSKSGDKTSPTAHKALEAISHARKVLQETHENTLADKLKRVKNTKNV